MGTFIFPLKFILTIVIGVINQLSYLGGLTLYDIEILYFSIKIYIELVYFSIKMVGKSRWPALGLAFWCLLPDRRCWRTLFFLWRAMGGESMGIPGEEAFFGGMSWLNLTLLAIISIRFWKFHCGWQDVAGIIPKACQNFLGLHPSFSVATLMRFLGFGPSLPHLAFQGQSRMIVIMITTLLHPILLIFIVPSNGSAWRRGVNMMSIHQILSQDAAKESCHEVRGENYVGVCRFLSSQKHRGENHDSRYRLPRTWSKI